MQHSFLNLMVKLWDVSSTGWKMSLEKLTEVRKNPKTLQKSGQDAGFLQPLEQGKYKAERLCPFFLSSWDVHLLTFLASSSSKSHWRMVHVWGPQGLENKARVAWRLFWPPIAQTHIPFAPFQPPQNYETLQLLSYQFTFLGVFPIWFPLSFFSYCLTVMSPSSAPAHPPPPPTIRHCFLSEWFVLSSLRRFCRRPLSPKSPHLYPAAIPTYAGSLHHICHSKGGTTQEFHEPLFAPLCLFYFLAQFYGAVCLGFKQCLRALAPKSNQMSQDFVQPSNHCILTQLQLTPSQLATSGLVTVECPTGTGHAFLRCHVDLRKVMVGTKGDWHKSSLGKCQEQHHLWIHLKTQFLRSAGTMWWGLRWDRNHSWPADQDNFTVQLTACISIRVWSITPATNSSQQRQQKQKESG